MAAPERFAESQIALAPRAPSIHGPSRHFAAAQQSVAFRGYSDRRMSALETSKMTIFLPDSRYCHGGR